MIPTLFEDYPMILALGPKNPPEGYVRLHWSGGLVVEKEVFKSLEEVPADV